MTTINEINDPAELAALEPQWSALLERTPRASFFHSLSWLRIYWKHFGAGQRLRVMVVNDGNQVTGILPLVVGTARRFDPVRALIYPLADWGNFYNPIGPDPLGVLTAVLDHVRRTRRDWHFIELGWIDSLADQGRTKSALDNAGFPVICETRRTSAIIDLTRHNSWDAYLASRSSKLRQELRRKEKRLAGRGEVTYLRYRPPNTPAQQADPRWDLYDACETISQTSWQAKVRNGRAIGKNTDRAFYRDCHLAAVRSGAVDLSLVFVEGQPVAFRYAYHFRGMVTGLNTAYDPAFAHEGAGTVILARTLADSFKRGDHTLDLGPDSTDWYKRQWLTDEWPIDCCTHFPPGSAAAKLVRAKRAMVRWWRAQKTAEANGSCGAHAEPQAIMSPTESESDTPDRGLQRESSDDHKPAFSEQLL